MLQGASFPVSDLEKMTPRKFAAYLVGDRRPEGTFVEPDRVFRTMALIPDL